jgi:hypothetical protein
VWPLAHGLTEMSRAVNRIMAPDWPDHHLLADNSRQWRFVRHSAWVSKDVA